MIEIRCEKCKKLLLETNNPQAKSGWKRWCVNNGEEMYYTWCTCGNSDTMREGENGIQEKEVK